MKPLHFVGTARKDLAGLPESARRRAGQELFMMQVGRKPNDYNPISTVGHSAYEIRARGEAGTFRVIYVAKFKHAVYVLHAFQKKTQETAKATSMWRQSGTLSSERSHEERTYTNHTG
jgi:phage-related protein